MTLITNEMSPREYADYVLGAGPKSLRSHTAGKSWQLPRPYNKSLQGVLEAGILREVRFQLANAGIWHRRLEGGGKIVGNKLIASSMSGLSDIIAIDANGRLVAMEIKRPGGRVSALQLATLESIIAAGGRSVICVDPRKAVAWCKQDIGAVGYVGKVPVI